MPKLKPSSGPVCRASIEGIDGDLSRTGYGVCDLESADAALLVLAEVVQTHIATHGPRSPIVIGVPPERTYTASVLDASVDELSAPSTMLARRGYFRAGLIESLAVEVMATEVGVTAVAACSREWIKKVVEICVTAGALVVRIEPAAVTLARNAFEAVRQTKPRVGARENIIHLISTERSCVTMWARGGLLLACRSLHLGPSREMTVYASECLTVIRGLEIFGQQRLGSTSRPLIVVHGDAELATLVEDLRAEFGADVRHVTRAAVSSEALALELARAARGTQRGLVDLGRAYWPTAALFELIPQREAATLTAAGLFLSAWMWWGVLDSQTRASLVEQQNAVDATLTSGRDSDLRAERNRLEAEVGAVRRFVGTRRLWTPCLNEIAANVPFTASLEGIIGQEELTSGLSRQDKRAKRQLIIDFVTDFPVNAAVPPEASDALQQLRTAAVISKAYPISELASLRLDRNKASADAPDRAKFSILCRPRGASSG